MFPFEFTRMKLFLSLRPPARSSCSDNIVQRVVEGDVVVTFELKSCLVPRENCLHDGRCYGVPLSTDFSLESTVHFLGAGRANDYALQSNE